MTVVDFRVRLPDPLRPRQEVSEWEKLTAKRYAEVFHFPDETPTVEELFDDLSAAGVDRAVVHAEYEYRDPADELNEAVAEFVARDPDRFAGFGTISLQPLYPMRAVAQVKRCKELGLLGINIQPGFFGCAIDERRLYPAYATCLEFGLAVGVHVGINYSPTAPLVNELPYQLEHVAADFPGLVLIACHAGWPWVPEMVAVARKQPDVYLEFGGLSPKYLAAEGSGWEVMLRFADRLLTNQILFATDWPVIRPARALAEWRELPLRAHTITQLLGGNAARLLSRLADRSAASFTDGCRDH